MSISQFNFPTIIRFGAGVIKEVGAHLKEQGLQRPLIVTDPFLKTLPPYKALVKSLESAGLSYETFSEIEKNPVTRNVMAGTEYYKTKNADSIIGFGGGAPMDVARTIAMKVNHDGELIKYADENGGDQLVVNPIPYFVTIPTTSGTGSEVGRSAVISDDETHEKKIYFHPNLMAKRVFADPELTLELPSGVTAATGVDALTHCVEAYFAKGYHPFCDGIALEGIRLVKKSLEISTNNPTLESRTDMMASAMMGATAFQKGLGVIHSLAHSLSTHFDLHHGLANAVMLTTGLKFNAEKFPEKIAPLAEALNLEDKSLDSVLAELTRINRNIGITQRLSDFGITKADIDKLSQTAYADVCHQCNPRKVELEDFKRLYELAL